MSPASQPAASTAAELERRAYEAIRQSTDVSQWREFLRLFPSGLYFDAARQRIDYLEKHARLEVQKREAAQLEAEHQAQAERDRIAADLGKIDDDAFATARSIGTRKAYEDYLKDYPQGRHAGDARKGLTSAAPASPGAKVSGNSALASTSPPPNLSPGTI
jgi:hypothetical protein